jgi:hypothetical protein
MGARAEGFAARFEDKAAEAAGAFEKLTEADWQKVTSAEKWPVGVVVRHVAWSTGAITGIMKAIASGQEVPKLSMDGLNAMNARNAQEWAGCTKPDTLALHEENSAAAAAVLRGIDDADFDRKDTAFVGIPAMSVQDLAELLVGHIDEHLASIRATV